MEKVLQITKRVKWFEKFCARDLILIEGPLLDSLVEFDSNQEKLLFTRHKRQSAYKKI